MKKLLLSLIIIFSGFLALAQAPASTTDTKKKMVKVKDKYYIEVITTSRYYTEITDQLLFEVDNEDQDEASEAQELARRQAERAEKREERKERNKLLKEAMEKGYKPNPTTLEDQAKVNKIRTKLRVKR